MGWLSNHNDKVDEKNRVKNAAWREKNNKRSQEIVGASSDRAKTVTTAQLAGGYNVAGRSAATATQRREAERELVKQLGEKEAKKLIDKEKNRVGKSFKGQGPRMSWK